MVCISMLLVSVVIIFFFFVKCSCSIFGVMENWVDVVVSLRVKDKIFVVLDGSVVCIGVMVDVV